MAAKNDKNIEKWNWNSAASFVKVEAQTSYSRSGKLSFLTYE